MPNTLSLFLQSSHNRRYYYNSAVFGQEGQELFDEINSWIKVGFHGLLRKGKWGFLLSKVHSESCISNNIIKPNIVFFESLDKFFDVVGVPQLQLVNSEVCFGDNLLPLLRTLLSFVSCGDMNFELGVFLMDDFD